MSLDLKVKKKAREWALREVKSLLDDYQLEEGLRYDLEMSLENAFLAGAVVQKNVRGANQ